MHNGLVKHMSSVIVNSPSEGSDMLTLEFSAATYWHHHVPVLGQYIAGVSTSCFRIDSYISYHHAAAHCRFLGYNVIFFVISQYFQW